MTVVVVVLVLAAAVVVGAELWLRHRGVQLAADAIADGMQADVELGVTGNPLLLHALRRHLPRVTIVATDVPMNGGRGTLDRLRVELEDVRLDSGWRRDRVLVAAGGRFAAHLRGEQLSRVVQLPNYVVSLDFTRRGLRLQTLGGVYVEAKLHIEPTSLLIRPATSVLRLLPASGLRVALPRLPFGARVETAELHEGWVEAHGHLDPDELRFDLDPPRPM